MSMINDHFIVSILAGISSFTVILIYIALIIVAATVVRTHRREVMNWILIPACVILTFKLLSLVIPYVLSRVSGDYLLALYSWNMVSSLAQAGAWVFFIIGIVKLARPRLPLS
ncbi:MAG: hypothetical protein GY754_25175 [bacterium]|nr:hypothetical protein [bacterium]